MASKANREYRNFALPIEVRAGGEGEQGYRVRGYAATFEPYLLCSFDGVDYYERIDPRAFDGADLSDVILRYDHAGMVFARVKNGTLTVAADERGLLVEADLSGTEAARQMFESIRAGLVDQMSFCFRVREDSYDRETHTRTILKIEKVYDVSPVSIPANPDTDIGTLRTDKVGGWKPGGFPSRPLGRPTRSNRRFERAAPADE